MVSPAGINDDRMVDHIEIPVVIAVSPCPTTMKLRSRTGEELTGKAVGITTIIGTVVASQITIVVRVAVDDLIISAELIVRVELRRSGRQRLRLLDVEVFVHTYLESCVVVVVKDASFNDVVRTLHLHAVVLGIADDQAVECPVVSEVVHIDATPHLEFALCGVVHT